MSFAAAILSKESALLTPIFCFVLEFLFFRFKRQDGSFSRLAVSGYAALFIVPALWVVFKIVSNANWFGQMYAGRPFDVEQRLFTQSIIVWFYLRNIFLPDVASMGLHRDDFPLFANPIVDPIVALSLIGHFALLLMAWKARERQKLIAFGVFFYYAGHLLESTFWPLELLYEHRNYLPTVGFAIMAGWYIPLLLRKVFGFRVTVLLCCLVVLMLAATTTLRSRHWGDPITFAMVEAEKHPESGRANFDAARELVVLMLRLHRTEPELAQMTTAYLEKSIGMGMISVEPYLLAYQAKAQLGLAVPEGFFEKYRVQLRSGRMPNTMYSFAQGLLSLSRFKDLPLSPEQLTILYEEALSNPRVGGVGRGHVLTAYSIFSAETLENIEKAYLLSGQAVQVAPEFIPFKQNAALMAYSAGRKEDALQLLSEIEAADRFGMYKQESARLKVIMESSSG
jgi:protein O-mannosyl-transferase